MNNFILKIKKWWNKAKKKELIKNRGLYFLLLPAIIFIIIFAYLPMIGVVIAFEDYDPIKGFFGSKFVAMENF